VHVFLDSEIIGIIKSLKTRASGLVESETIEFKEYSSESALHNSKELTEEICALANHHGGIVVIGVRDSSRVENQDWPSQLAGFSKIDETKTRERLCGRLKPQLDITVRSLTVDGKNFLVIRVPDRRDTLVSTSSGENR
jgi:ATP-dependent DNA helicase RecG